MPTYNMHCDGCGADFSVTQSIHHPLPTSHTPPPMRAVCPGTVVQVYSPPTITGFGPSGIRKAHELARERDVDAYRRLRKNGVQPPTVADSAEIEARANEPIEVERNTAFENKGLRRRMQSAATEAAATQQVA